MRYPKFSDEKSVKNVKKKIGKITWENLKNVSKIQKSDFLNHASLIVCISFSTKGGPSTMPGHFRAMYGRFLKIEFKKRPDVARTCLGVKFLLPVHVRAYIYIGRLCKGVNLQRSGV